MRLKLKDLKVSIMTSEGWIIVPLSESPYYKSACAIQEWKHEEARDIFMDYIKEMFLYDKRPGKIHEMSWSRFLDLSEILRLYGMIQPEQNEIKIDEELLIHDGQHRLAVWYSLGNEDAKVSRFWTKKDVIKSKRKHYPVEARERQEQLKRSRDGT